MKKPYRLIIIGVLAIIIVTVLKDKPKEDLRATANISEELSQLSTQKSFGKKSVNFTNCDPDDSFSVNLGLGSSKLKIIGAENEHCITQTTFETEGGYYVNECKIPLSLGQIVFIDNNFDEISRYCQLKTTGNGLLELE